MRRQATLKVLAILALVFCVAFGAQLCGFARANPYPFFGIPRVDPVPGTTPPLIVIVSPQNGTTYPSGGAVSLSFNVTKPQLATAHKTNVTWVYYLLDNQPFVRRTIVNSIYDSTDDVTYTANLTLPEGNHELMIYAEGVVYSGGGIFMVNNTAAAFFTVASPSTPSSSTSENNSLNIPTEALYAIAIVAVVAVIVVAVLVIKRKYVK